MKYIYSIVLFAICLTSYPAPTPWVNYPTTNGFAVTDTLIMGNGSTNLTIQFGAVASTLPITNTVNASSNLVYGNAVTQINTTSNTLNTLVNTSSNLVYGNAVTQINTTSNLLNTLVNTSSNLVYGNGVTQINTTSNLLNTQINTSSNLTYGNAVTQINTTSNLLNTLVNTSSNLNFANTITAINTSSNLVYGNAQIAINTSSNSVVTNLPPRANYPALTNSVTGTLGNVLMTTTHLDTNGSPAALWTNLQMINLEFHISTNAFTNVVVGYIGPLTNIDGFRFYIPVGTNFP